MRVKCKNFRTIWFKDEESNIIKIIDQRFLPHRFIIEELTDFNSVLHAIKDMHVRGAGLIGATAGYGIYLAAVEAGRKTDSNFSFDNYLEGAGDILISARPTAVNLRYAVKRVLEAIKAGTSINEKIKIARETAINIADEDAEYCRRIGVHGVKLIEDISCLLYTSPSPRDRQKSRMPSSA